MPLISDPSRVRADLTGLTTLAFDRFEDNFGTLGETPFPGAYTSAARYLAMRIAIPHWFVHSTQVGSADSDRKVNRTPRETFEEGGNCVDRCVLLGSMWATLSVPSELLSIVSADSDEGHLTAVAKVPAVDGGPTVDELKTELARIYAEHLSRDVPPADVFSWTDGGDTYVIADPIFSAHVGDVDSMVEHGFATVDGDDLAWNFHNEIQDVIVPTDGAACHRFEL